MRPATSQPTFLVHRVTCLGDVLLSLHVPKALKEAHPGCHVTFSTSPQYAAVPGHCRYVDAVVTDRSAAGDGFTATYDLDGVHRFDHLAGEGELERIDLISRAIRLPVLPGPPPYSVDASAREWAAEHLAEARGPLIGVVASAGSPKRRRSIDATRRLVLDLLADVSEARVALIDASPKLWQRVGLSDTRVLNACGTLSIPRLAALLEQLDLLITCDTGTLHLAAAARVPQVAFFSEIGPHARISSYPGVFAAYNREACEHWPCGYFRRCRKGEACINSVGYAGITWAVKAAIDARGGAMPAIDVRPSSFCITYVGSLSSAPHLPSLVRAVGDGFSWRDPVSLVLVTPDDEPASPSATMDAVRVALRQPSAPEIVWKRLPATGPARWPYIERASEQGVLVSPPSGLADQVRAEAHEFGVPVVGVEELLSAPGQWSWTSCVWGAGAWWSST